MVCKEKKEERKQDQRKGEKIVGQKGWYNCLLDGLISYRVTPRRISGGAARTARQNLALGRSRREIAESLVENRIGNSMRRVIQKVLYSQLTRITKASEDGKT